jgi:hypothetical protein
MISNAYMRKEERSQIINHGVYLKKLEKEDQMKLDIRRKRK